MSPGCRWQDRRGVSGIEHSLSALAFIVAAGMKMAMDGIGLVGKGGHTLNETAELGAPSRHAKRVAVLLARLVSQPR